MMRRKYVLIILLIAVMGLGVVLFPKKDLWASNADLLRDKMRSELTDGDQVILAEFTPFEWDEVYTFNPYVPKEVIYETIGYKWDQISETVSEGMNQIVFVKDGEVICYIYGYPENNGFGIFFNYSNVNEEGSILYAADRDVFDVQEVEEIVYLQFVNS